MMTMFSTFFINLIAVFLISLFMGMVMMGMSSTTSHTAMSPMHQKHQQGE
jgi:hypothetical protein